MIPEMPGKPDACPILRAWLASPHSWRTRRVAVMREVERRKAAILAGVLEATPRGES